SILPHGERLQRANFALDALGAFTVTFINDKDVGDFHDAGLDGLHVVAHAGDENHDGDIGEAHDINLVLTHADGFDQHQVAPGGVEHGCHIRSGVGQSAERTARGHAANVN